MKTMAFFDYFRRSNAGSATLAKDRLSIIVAREGRSLGKLNYLPQLRQELLAVLAKYEKIDLDQVSVNVESQGECDVLELNVILSEPSAVKRRDNAHRNAPFFSDVAPRPERRSAAPR
jgi:cell division topological specificity factor